MVERILLIEDDPRLADMLHEYLGQAGFASVPIGSGAARLNLHLLVIFAALAIGLIALPIVRQLTGRLERLQRGVDSLGAGDFGARVAVEGHDEIAGLAESFNRAVTRIEQLIHANRSLLANASHELRTPLARIRLAVEMLKQSADSKTKAGLEQDIAALDGLVDEILLASRLDTVARSDVCEEVDLLALAAAESARYDEVRLGGEHLNPGPAPAEFEQVFTPFYRRRDSRNSTGNGLGLSLVRQIARRHGGDARCASMDDGRSCFVVTLVGGSSA
ncbi:MAG: HAMP domain-containing protein [Steroidobacteraceae bacterium]